MVLRSQSVLLDHHYLWSTRFVCERLRVGGISEATLFRYFLAIMAFDWLQFTSIATTPAASITAWSLVSSWSTLLITIAGLVYLYLRNGGAQGRQFLYRYFPLSVTVGWKFVVAGFVSMWFVAWVLAGASAEARGWTSTIVLAAINLVMLWRIGAHLASLAHEPAA